MPWRPALAVTGAGTVLGATLGGHAINLAAISAALAAGPEAGPDKGRRWLAGISTGCTYLVLGGLSAGLVTAVLVAPDGVVAAVAGVALVGAFASACAGAMADADARLPAAITFLVAASGVAIAGLGSAFWALAAGLVLHGLRPRATPNREEATPPPAERP